MIIFKINKIIYIYNVVFCLYFTLTQAKYLLDEIPKDKLLKKILNFAFILKCKTVQMPLKI